MYSRLVEFGYFLNVKVSDGARSISVDGCTFCCMFEQFMDYLYSSHNSIWNEQHSKVTQDMDQPLNNYWIASSHNTWVLHAMCIKTCIL